MTASPHRVGVLHISMTADSQAVASWCRVYAFWRWRRARLERSASTSARGWTALWRHPTGARFTAKATR